MSHPRIVVAPPGPRARDIVRSNAAFASPSTRHLYPLVVKSAQGCFVRDVDGNEFVDFDSADGVMNIGHNHPQVLNLIREQVEDALHYGYGNAYYELLPRLSKALSEITPGSMSKRFFYSNSGSEAIEAGMKAASWHTRGRTFLCFTGSTHGRTLGALSLSGSNPVHRRHYPALAETVVVPYPYCYRCPCALADTSCDCACLDVLETYMNTHVAREEVAALALEPIQAAGCVVPPERFFGRLRRFVEDQGVLLLADEVLTGIGRTGRWFGLDNWGVTPDILCVNGSLSTGLPLGVTVARDGVMDWDPDSHTSTLGGNPIACISAISVLDVIKAEHLLENSVKQGRYMLRRLRELVSRYPILGEARGKGLLVGLEIVEGSENKRPNPEGARKIALKSWRRGVLFQVVGASTLRFCPPLTVTEQLVDIGLETVEAAVREVVTDG